MRHAASRFTDSIQSGGMRRRRLILAGVLLALFATPATTSAFAAEHLTVTGEYGKEGPKASGIGSGCHIAFNSSTQRLYLSSDGKIYGLSVSPGSATPLGGNFPFTTGINDSCGEPDIEVESGGAGNIYGVQSGSSGKIYGWDSAGNALPSYPVSVPGGGEICGVDVGPSGGPWAGNYSQERGQQIHRRGSSGRDGRHSAITAVQGRRRPLERRPLRPPTAAASW